MPDRSDETFEKIETQNTETQNTETVGDLAATFARARWLMIISALTTAIAIVAVAGVIGYRFFNRGESISGTIVNGTVFLPKGAHVDATTISEGRIVVTFDIEGATEVRFFDLKTLQRIGELHFATEH